MTSVSSLDGWNAEHGNEDYTAPNKGGNRFRLQTGMCYPITIRGATLCKSQLGEIQVMVDMDVKDYHSGKVVSNAKDWVSLPFQPITDMGKNHDIVKKLTMIRRNVLSTILSAIDPQRFCLGKKEDLLDRERIWHSWEDDHVLTHEEMNDRKIQCNREVLKYAEECHQSMQDVESVSLDEWRGTELYHSKKENERNPKYPYSRYHVEPAFGLPLFSQESASNDPPF